MNELDHPRLVELAFQTVDRLLQVGKEQVLEAEGVRLHPSEIHLLLFLHGKPEANAKEIGNRFSITKGAVSQTLARLETKGVLERHRRPQSPSELRIKLTGKGEKLMVQALKLKEGAERRFDVLFSSLSPSDREAVERFLRLLGQD